MLFKKEPEKTAEPVVVQAQTNPIDVAQQIMSAFNKTGLKYSLQNLSTPPTTIIRAGVSGQAFTFQVLFLIVNGGRDVSIFTDPIAKFPAEKTTQMIELANELNEQFRFAKFTVDKDNCNLVVRGDIPGNTTSAGDEAVEYLLRFMKIIDDAGPRIMKTIWA